MNEENLGACGFERIDDGTTSEDHGADPLQEMIVGAYGWFDLVNRYLKGSIYLKLDLFDFLRRPGCSDRGDFVFITHFDATKCLLGDDCTSRRDMDESRGDATHPRIDDVQSAVPVNSCEIMKESKGAIVAEVQTRRRQGWSVTRLHRSDDFVTSLAEFFLPIFHLPHSALETVALGIGIDANRELPLLLVIGALDEVFLDSALKNSAVKSGAEMIKHLTEVYRRRHRDRRDFATNEGAECPFAFILDANSVGVFFPCPIPGLFKGISVGVGPMDSLPTSVETHVGSNWRRSVI